MKIEAIISDSLGVRSMATIVETADVRMFIDPSAALGPSRYGLSPHPLEWEKLEKAKELIARRAEGCDFFTITHYHYDHYDPSEGFYKEKKVFAKCIDRNINKSQKERGTLFAERVKNECEIIYCDDSSHSINNTTITFSPPFPHGPRGIKLGYVIMVTVEEEGKMLFASDVQGPVDEKATEYIIQQQPNILIMDGPPSYFLGWRFSQENLNKAERNLMSIIEKTGCSLVLDHHLLRDLKYKTRFPELYEKYGKKIKTFAEFNGKKNVQLEARRKELWEKYA